MTARPTLDELQARANAKSEAEVRCESAGRVLLQAVANAHKQGVGADAILTLVHGIEAALIILDPGKSEGA